MLKSKKNFNGNPNSILPDLIPVFFSTSDNADNKINFSNCSIHLFSIYNMKQSEIIPEEKIIRKKPLTGIARKFDLLMINSEESFVLIDTEFKIITFNDQFKGQYAEYFDKEIHTGESILNYSQGQTLENLKNIYQKVFSGKIIETEIQINLADNSKRHFSIKYKPAYDETKLIIGAFVSSHDITQLKQAQLMIKETEDKYLSIIENLNISRDLSEMKKSQRELVFNEKRFRSIIENSQDMITLYDRKGQLEYISPEVERTFGYESEKDYPKRLADLVHPDDMNNVNAIINQMFDAPELPVKALLRVKKKNGYYIWIEGTITNMLEVEGLNTIVSNFRDVTEQKNTQELLSINEKCYRALVENSHDMLILLNSKGKIEYISPAVEKNFGYSNKDVYKKTVLDLVHPDDIEFIKKFRLDVFRNPGVPVHTLLRNKKRDGSYIWVEGTITNMLHMPEVSAVVVNFRDVNERKNLEEQQALYVSIVNSSEDAIISITIDDIITSWNRGAEKLFGYTPEEALGRDISMLTPVDLLDEEPKILEKIKCGEFVEFYEKKRIRKDGTSIFISLIISPIKDIKGNIIGASNIARDISERKEAEERFIKNEESLKDLNEQVVKRVEELAISNAELEQFAYIASHDLQEPLRMVTSFLTQLQKKYEGQLDDKARQYIHFATDGAARMRKIIIDLLEYSRAGRKAHDIEEIDMNDLLGEVIQLNRTIIEDKEALIKWGSLPVIRGGRTPLQQVFQNLISNGLKYQKESERSRIVIESIETPGHWQFSIADNGIGIDPLFFDKIFIVFQRLHNKDEYSGTGIGLAICKKIIENHKGKIWVESKPGEGSTFYFTIPKKA